MDPRSQQLAVFALTGFANFASIGIQLGGIGAAARPGRADRASGQAGPAGVAGAVGRVPGDRHQRRGRRGAARPGPDPLTSARFPVLDCQGEDRPTLAPPSAADAASRPAPVRPSQGARPARPADRPGPVPAQAAVAVAAGGPAAAGAIPRRRVPDAPPVRTQPTDRRGPRRGAGAGAARRPVPRPGGSGGDGPRPRAGARPQGGRLDADQRAVPRRRARPASAGPLRRGRRAGRAGGGRRVRRVAGQRLPRDGGAAARGDGLAADGGVRPRGATRPARGVRRAAGPGAAAGCRGDRAPSASRRRPSDRNRRTCTPRSASR